MKRTKTMAAMLIAAALLAGCGAFAGEKTGVDTSGSGAAPAAQQSEQPAVTTAAEEPAAETIVGTKPAQETVQEGVSMGTERTTVTVTSDHGVKVVPDTAEIAFGVQTYATTAKKAQEDNTKDVNRVIDTLKGLGVEEKDIRTTGYDMYPRYDNQGVRIVGYNMYTNLSVSNQSIERAGEIIGACVEAGVNNMNGISYTYSAYNEAYAEALGHATKASAIKAQAIAEAAGKKLGSIESIQEGYQDVSLRRSYQSNIAYDAKEEAAMDSVAIMPGEVSVRAQVTVTYVLE